MIKSVLIAVLIIITITMGYILRMLLRIYRVLVCVGSPTDIEKFNNIAVYQNII
jgi:predicted lipase